MDAVNLQGVWPNFPSGGVSGTGGGGGYPEIYITGDWRKKVRDADNSNRAAMLLAALELDED